MTGARVTVSVGPTGTVTADHWETGDGKSGEIAYGGLDAELIEHFERWLTSSDRVWRIDEIRSFGSLLHRCLFPRSVWTLIRDLLFPVNGNGRTPPSPEEPLHLALRFPLTGAYARLASLPWEYLHCPEETGYRRFFLADESAMVLSRYVPPSPNAEALRPSGRMSIKAVVSQPPDPLLGPVEADDVLTEIERTANELDVPFQPTLANPPLDQLEQELHDQRPHVLHFMGHGRFDTDRAEGELAFTTADGGDSDWVNESRLVSMMQRARAVPRVVVLHACEGGATDFVERFAGVGPSLIRGGVAAVVAMQYEVTNETASAFSSAFYTELRKGIGVERAVQAGRRQISGQQDGDPRLRGIPMVYRDGSTVLAPEGDDDSVR